MLLNMTINRRVLFEVRIFSHRVSQSNGQAHTVQGLTVGRSLNVEGQGSQIRRRIEGEEAWTGKRGIKGCEIYP